jgi:DNA modification methylase
MLPLNSVHFLPWDEFMSEIDAESVDLVLTDPPYESLTLHRGGSTSRMGLGSFGSIGWDPDKFIETIPNTSLLFML